MQSSWRWRDGVLAAPVKRGEQAGILLADVRGRSGSGKPGRGEGGGFDGEGCFLLCGNGWGRLFSANFHEGTVSVYRIEGIEGSPGKKGF